MDTAIYKANEKMSFLSKDKEILRLYDIREMEEFDYNSGMKKAKEEGRAEGRAEGEAEGLKLAAKNLIALNSSTETIIQATGLSIEVIDKLRKES